MVCAFIVMKCEGFTQITDLMDYLDNNRLIAHYCGFNIMEPLPSYWTYDRCLRQLNNGALKSIMANLVRKLYEPVSYTHLDVYKRQMPHTSISSYAAPQSISIRFRPFQIAAGLAS